MIISTSPLSTAVTLTPPKSISVTAPIGKQGPPGPPGPPGADALWDRMTQAEFDALPTKDSNVLYIIIG